MSAQPVDHFGAARPAPLPRTIRAIRAALPEDKRAEFAADLEDSESGGLVAVVNKWWTRAQVWSDPDAMAAIESYRAGSWQGVPAEEAFAGRWPA